MKISKAVLVLWSAGLGLSLVYSQQKSDDTPTKAQLILRERIAQLNKGASLPSKEGLLADVERLHNEGKISDQQFENFKKNIDKEYVGPEGNPEVQAKAQKMLDQKIAELNARQTVSPAPANPEAREQAEQSLRQRITQNPPTHPETAGVSGQVLQQKLAELRSPEKFNIVPGTADARLTPELEPRARELLRLKIAESRGVHWAQPESNPEAQARALAVLHEREARLKAGGTPEASEQARLLRARITESKGTGTPAEAPQAVAATTPPPAEPAIGASPVTIQSSNKVGLARLNELTDLYKADKITPHEYHHERAKIVATL